MVVSIDLRVSRVTFVLAFLLIVRDLSLTTLDCSGEEESFPASDPPSWTATRDRTPPLHDAARVVNGYYFIADADSSICGLCIRMQVRTR